MWILSCYVLRGLPTADFSPLPLLQKLFHSQSYIFDFVAVSVFALCSVALLWKMSTYQRTAGHHGLAVPVWLIYGALIFPCLCALFFDGDPQQQASTSAATVTAISIGITVCFVSKSSRVLVSGLSFLVLIQSFYSVFYYAIGMKVLKSGEVYRAGGTFFDPNQLYTLMLVTIPLFLVMAVRSSTYWPRLWYLVCAGASTATFLITFYRAGMLSLVLCLGWLAWRLTRNMNGAAFTIILLSPLLFFTIVHRSQGEINAGSLVRSNIGHYRLIKEGVRVFSLHPVTGVGSGRFEATVVVPSKNGISSLERHVLEPKNTVLFYLCELGTVGGILLFMLVKAVSTSCINLRHKNPQLAVAVECAGIALLSAGLFDTTFGHGDRYIGNLSMGIIIGLSQLGLSEGKNEQDVQSLLEQNT